jgi:HlyD family secretion protein
VIGRIQKRWILGPLVVVGLAVLSAACVQFAPVVLPRLTHRPTDDPVYQLAQQGLTDQNPASANATPVTVPTAQTQQALVPVQSSSGLQAVPVRRGSISEVLSMVGRIGGMDETPLKFANTGKVSTIDVSPGQSVKQGQVLIETGADQIQSQLDEAQAELETQNIRLQQAQAQAIADAQSRKLDSQRQSQDAAASKRASAADAEAALHRAQADLAAVQAGPSPVDVHTAEGALAAAQAASQKAEADLAKLTSGPDPTAVRAAQNTLAQAKTAVDRAQSDHDKLANGPDPNAVRTAEREVERAQTTLKYAQAVKLDPKATSKDVADHDQAIAQAQLDVQDAQDRLNALKQPPDATALGIAQRTLDQAKAAALDAQHQLDALNAGPTQDAIDKANAAIDAAHAAQQNAQDRLDEINSHPTPNELRTAQDKVAAAQAALDRVNGTSGPSPAPTDDPGTAYNQVLLEKDMARIQARIDGLQQDLANTQVVAPFDGFVTAIQVRPGDQITPGTTVMLMSRDGVPAVRVEPSEKDLPRLSVGQTANFDIAGLGGVTGHLSSIGTVDKSSGAGTSQVAVFTLDVPKDKPAPALGTSVQVQVAVQQIADALLVPKKAIHSAGPRQYVQVQQGGGRAIANVDVGITGRDDVQILTGLSQGQLVLVGP